MATEPKSQDYHRRALERNLRSVKKPLVVDYLAAVIVRWLSQAAVLWYAFLCILFTADTLFAFTYQPNSIRVSTSDPPDGLEILYSILPCLLPVQLSLIAFVAAGWYLEWRSTMRAERSAGTAS